MDKQRVLKRVAPPVPLRGLDPRLLGHRLPSVTSRVADKAPLMTRQASRRVS
jgi:hypothetical protein